jgi:hypothetical protein
MERVMVIVVLRMNGDVGPSGGKVRSLVMLYAAMYRMAHMCFVCGAQTNLGIAGTCFYVA